MSLDALKVALQGLFNLTPIALAVQGLIEEIQKGGVNTDTGQGMSRKNYENYLARNLAKQREARERRAREEYNKTRLRDDDQLAVDFITALLHSGILHG